MQKAKSSKSKVKVEQVEKYRGYYSIVRKSLFKEEDRLREILINLLMQCEESEISSVLFCLEDIDVFFQDMTAGMQAFLHKCFIKNQ